jgi:hypothetical protein
MLRRGALAASCVAPLPLGIRVREDVSCVPFVRMHLSVAFQHEFTAPLCRLHHRAVHLARNEAEWWSKLGLDAVATAIRLWKMTRAAGEPTLHTAAKPDTAQRGRAPLRRRSGPDAELDDVLRNQLNPRPPHDFARLDRGEPA